MLSSLSPDDRLKILAQRGKVLFFKRPRAIARGYPMAFARN